MEADPITGTPIPPEAIQRILHISPKVHVYRILPITSTKGFAAASWTQNPADQIFTARLRVIETAIPPPLFASQDTPEKVSVHILLEDALTGELFAAAPYTHPSAVEQASDSSRFFAVRVVGNGGKMKATLGIGFEERPDAFDFSVALQDVRRTLGLDGPASGANVGTRTGPQRGGRGAQPVPKKEESEVKKDFSLKEGEMITINIGGKGRRTSAKATEDTSAEGMSNSSASLFSIPPPPSAASMKSGAMPFLPPPPSAADVKAGMKGQQALSQQSASSNTQPTAEELGFDDGEFGEFQ
jgi:hypothetical protein